MNSKCGECCTYVARDDPGYEKMDFYWVPRAANVYVCFEHETIHSCRAGKRCSLDSNRICSVSGKFVPTVRRFTVRERRKQALAKLRKTYFTKQIQDLCDIYFKHEDQFEMNVKELVKEYMCKYESEEIVDQKLKLLRVRELFRELHTFFKTSITKIIDKQAHKTACKKQERENTAMNVISSLFQYMCGMVAEDLLTNCSHKLNMAEEREQPHDKFTKMCRETLQTTLLKIRFR